MFGRHKIDEETRAADERLGALLRRWDGIEPRTNFEASVWRRIHSAPATEARGFQPGVLRGLVAPPMVWANAALVAVAILAGVWAGTARPRESRAVDPLLYAETLAGSYLNMVTGGTQ